MALLQPTPLLPANLVAVTLRQRGGRRGVRRTRELAYRQQHDVNATRRKQQGELYSKEEFTLEPDFDLFLGLPAARSSSAKSFREVHGLEPNYSRRFSGASTLLLHWTIPSRSTFSDSECLNEIVRPEPIVAT